MMKKSTIIFILVGGVLGWIVIITTIFSSFFFRSAWGMGLTDIIVWTIWERNDNIQPDSTKLVGIWSAKDGATIELNKDGTCSLRNVQRIIEYTACSGGEDTSSVWNYSGYWRVEPELSFYKGRKDTIGFKVYLDNRSPFDVEWEKGDCEVRLRIHNEKVSKDIVPVLLYNFIGDPDNFETYDFYKL